VIDKPNASLEKALSDAIPAMSIVSYAEVARFYVRRLRDEDWRQIKAKLAQLRIIGLDAETCEIAAAHSKRLGLSLADSLIYATATKNGIPLLTCDADFKGKKDVIFIK
jgi:predicted nucleic acid-binding protein